MSIDEKPTVELPAVPQWAIELTREVKGARADIGLVSSDLGLLKDRVVLIEKRVTDGEERAARTSARVEGSSAVDLDHESKIAAGIVKAIELEKAIHETNALAVSAVNTLKAQSDFMGMGKKGLEWLRSKEARADILRVATLVAAGYAALKQMGVIK